MNNYLGRLIFLLLTSSLFVSCDFGPRSKLAEVKDPEILLAKADSFVKIKSYDSAIHLYSKLIAKDKENGEYFFKRASCFMLTGDFWRAGKDFRKSIDYDYNAAGSYYGLGLSCPSSKDSLALTYFRKALELDSTLFLAKERIIEYELRIKKEKSWSRKS